MRQLALRLTFIIFSLAGTAYSIAQDTPSGSDAVDNDMESLYDQMDQQSDQATKSEEAVSPKASTDKAKDEGKPAKPLSEAKTITDLNRLQPFSDIAVIQRRFLPKTGRFELNVNGMTNLNNPWFNNFGGSGKLAYYMTERWALEIVAMGFSVASRQVTQDLQTSNNITTTNVVTAQSFFGGAIKWNPIYGKVSFLDRSIVPFDVNFDLGAGVTGTNYQNREEPTIHFATSQNFALSKSFSFRWGLDWNFYNAETLNPGGQQVSVFHNDLFIGLGLSVYFPGATYR